MIVPLTPRLLVTLTLTPRAPESGFQASPCIPKYPSTLVLPKALRKMICQTIPLEGRPMGYIKVKGLVPRPYPPLFVLSLTSSFPASSREKASDLLQAIYNFSKLQDIRRFLFNQTIPRQTAGNEIRLSRSNMQSLCQSCFLFLRGIILPYTFWQLFHICSQGKFLKLQFSSSKMNMLAFSSRKFRDVDDRIRCFFFLIKLEKLWAF